MRRPVDPLSCADVDARLEAWLDGELPRDESAAVDAHLAACSECAAEAVAARTVRDELRALPSLETPPRVLDTVRRQTLLPKRWITVGVVAAAATVMLSIGLGIHQARRPDPQAAQVARATAEAKYALSLIARATRQASSGVENELLERPVLSPAIHELLGVLHQSGQTPPDREPSPSAKDRSGV